MKLEKENSKFDDLINNLIGYLETKSELYKIEIKQELIRLLAKLIAAVVLGILLIIFLLFLSLTLGNYINTLLDSSFTGYLVISGLFLVILVILILLRNTRVYRYFIDLLMANYFELDSKIEDEERS
ncbi:MAG: phage holin family protein [Cyclobacteriaceae bacterium]